MFISIWAVTVDFVILPHYYCVPFAFLFFLKVYHLLCIYFVVLVFKRLLCHKSRAHLFMETIFFLFVYGNLVVCIVLVHINICIHDIKVVTYCYQCFCFINHPYNHVYSKWRLIFELYWHSIKVESYCKQRGKDRQNPRPTGAAKKRMVRCFH